jgi:SAM-dependent methyltransferase
MTEPRGYVDTRYLGDVAAFVSALKARTYELMHLEPGQAVLDVGCGPGTDTFALAGLVGEQGRAVGVDHDQAMVDEAQRRVAAEGSGSRVEHVRADSASLPFDDGSFDACRSERLFQHLPDPGPTLSEMARVTRPGGRIVVLDTDWGSLSIDTAEIEAERRLVRALADGHLHNGYSGRQLRRLFLRQGLADVGVELHPLLVTSYPFARQAALLDRVEEIGVVDGALTREDVQRLHASLEAADAEGVFFCSVTMVMAVGRKPGAAPGDRLSRDAAALS